MPWGAALAVGGSLIAGSMQADAAGDAADAQSRSADKADATQRYTYDTTRADNAPFRESGVAANNQLSYRLGLGNGGGPTNALTRDQLRADLLPQFTTTPAAPQSSGYFLQTFEGPDWVSPTDPRFSPQQSATPAINDFGLNAAIEARLAQQQQQATAAQSAAQNDPAYGSLMRNFSANDLNADPVYQSGLQFGLDEGAKGINRMAAASGSSLSGATLKALTRFGNDYGSTKANESYNRFNTNQNSLYNKLAGVSGAGQQATNQVSAAGANMANNVSNNALYAGSVRGASAIAQGNALTGAMNNIYGIGKKKGWWDTGSGGGLSDFTPSYAGTGNPFNWTNGDS
jgi:hypothetical protein